MKTLKQILSETKEQQETAEFKSWFKNSKVVDSEGKPLRVYHGTSKDSDFSKFNVKQNGMWFTSSSDSASGYASDNDSMKMEYDYSGNIKNINTASRVIPVYLSLQNPATLSDKQLEKLKVAQNYSKAQREVFGELKMKGHDGVILGDDTFVVFHPNQIKSAIGNNGKFDSMDHHIHK